MRIKTLSFKEKLRTTREDAFTLVEIVVGLVVLGVLTAIAVPVFFTIQNELNSQQVRAELTQAALLIETEAIDNNGLYATYVPNEVLKLSQGHPADTNQFHISNLVYTFSDDRTNWCLQSDSPLGKLFVSSTNKTASGDVCTYNNLGSNSNTPWQVPTIPVSSINQFTNEWSSNSSYALATVRFTPITCDLAGVDVDEWGEDFYVEYSVRLLNSTRATPVINPTAWSPDTTVAITLNGWLPEDNMVAQVRSRCVTNYGVGYQYTGDYSIAVPGQVVWFEVNDAAWTATPSVTWTAGNNNPRYSASWTPAVFCPAGTPGYALSITGTLTSGAGSLAFPGSVTSPAAWASGWINGIISANTLGGTSVNSNMKVVCTLDDGRKRASSGITHTITEIPIKAPTPIPNISHNNSAGETLVFPNTLTWTANGGTCQVGTLEYRVARTSPSNATLLNWGTATESEETFVAGTAYTYTVQTRCVDGTKISATRGTGSTTFTAYWNIPPSPATVTGLISTTGGTAPYTNNRVTWSHVTCPNSTPVYVVRQTMKNGTNIAASSRPTSGLVITTNHYSLPDGWVPAGSHIGVEVAAICRGPGGDSPLNSYTTPVTWYTSIPRPNQPEVTNDGVQRISWTADACPADTTLVSDVVQTRYENTYSTWEIATNYTGIKTRTISQYNEGRPVAVRVTVKCAGPNVTSASSIAGLSSWTTTLSTPSMMNNKCASSSCGGTNVVWGTATCAAGVSAALWLKAGKQGRWHYGPYSASNNQKLTGNSYWSGNAWGSSWYTSSRGRCSTAWVTSSFRYASIGTWGPGSW